MLLTLAIFIAILALLVLAHEIGHFMVARKNGIKVDEFGFGFPPRIFGLQIFSGEKLEKVAESEKMTVERKKEMAEDKEIIKELIIDERVEIDKETPVKKWRFVFGHRQRGGEENLSAGTIYSLNLIPLGGFVKIKGEDGEWDNELDSFSHKKIWQRVLVLIAGVLMNFVLAVFLLGIGFIIGLPQALDSLGRGAVVKDAKIEIMSVIPGSPAAQADLKAGDEFIKADSLAVKGVKDLQKYVDEKKGQSVRFFFRRGAGLLEKEITPINMAEINNKGGIGVALLESGIVSYPWYYAFPRGLEAAGYFTVEVFRAFGNLISSIFKGSGGVTENLAGPVGIAVLTGRVARLGINHLLQFAALLSINLAILNILPFPALDGGRVLFLIIEKFRGRPLRRRVENIIHTTGFALLMLLVAFITYKDVVRFSSGFIRLGKKILGG